MNIGAFSKKRTDENQCVRLESLETGSGMVFYTEVLLESALGDRPVGKWGWQDTVEVESDPQCGSNWDPSWSHESLKEPFRVPNWGKGTRSLSPNISCSLASGYPPWKWHTLENMNFLWPKTISSKGFSCRYLQQRTAILILKKGSGGVTLDPPLGRFLFVFVGLRVKKKKAINFF